MEERSRLLKTGKRKSEKGGDEINNEMLGRENLVFEIIVITPS
jgi:hypothetical protein